jgi:hypothetical protein
MQRRVHRLCTRYLLSAVRRQKLYIVAQAHPSNSSFRKKQRQRQIKEKEHKARPSRLDLDQIVSTRCNPEQDQDKGSREMDFRLCG